MKRKKSLPYYLLLSLTILLTLAAVSTMIPVSMASKVCLLGYKAHCTFTPISTIMLILMAGSVCVIRAKKFK